MPETNIYEELDSCVRNLKLDFCSQELTTIASDHHYTAEQLQTVADVFDYLSTKKQKTRDGDQHSAQNESSSDEGAENVRWV